METTKIKTTKIVGWVISKYERWPITINLSGTLHLHFDSKLFWWLFFWDLELSKSTIIKIENLLNETCDYSKQLNVPQLKRSLSTWVFSLKTIQCYN